MLSVSGPWRVACLFLSMAGIGLAQKATGEIRGAVQDPGNAFVPKASITARDNSTGLTFGTVSGGDGAYIVPNLLPGSYSVTVTAPGFQTSVIDNVVVETGRSREVPVQLEVGAVSQTVEVSGSSIASNRSATSDASPFVLL